MAQTGTSDNPVLGISRDPDGKMWALLRQPFERWDGLRVVVATEGAEVHGNLVVQREIHIPAEEWDSWEVIR